MNRKRSQNTGCLIAALIVLGLGALVLFVDYLILREHSVSPFCSSPECAAMRRFLDVSAISAVVVLTCATLAACNTWPRVLPVAAVAGGIVSIVAGFMTGIGMWSLPNAMITGVVMWLLLLLWADR